jgi:co-chaperonin GroES (HSP10)
MTEPAFFCCLDNVLVKVIEGPKQTKGGILLPDKRPDDLRLGTSTGEVLTTGPGARFEGKHLGMDLKKGDKVYFSLHRAYEVELNGEKLHVVPERDIVGYVR